MITNTRDQGEEFSADKLDNINNDNNGGSSSSITIKPADSATTSSSAWLRSKDPRIVRVSRAFGGKDRHSKVCTIRGLRDRRVRLSVPTAIQLYDLQDRLGLNQPSKVVDWLLNVAKDDIDELPPLQIPPGFNFIDQAHQAMLSSSSSHAANQQRLGSTSQGEPAVGSKINASWELEDAAPSSIGLHKSSFWTNSQSTSTKFKHVVGAKEVIVMNEKEMWTKGMQEDDDHKLQTLELSHGGGGGMQQQVDSSSNSYDFPRSSNNQSSLPNFLHSTVSPYAAASYYHFDYPSNFSLSSSISSQAEDQQQHHNSYNVVPLLQSTTTSLSLPSGPHHVLVYPPSSQSNYFPSHVSSTAAPMELDPRQFINHFQILSPSQQQNSLHMSLDDVNKKR